LEQATAPELSQAKAQAREVLAKTPNDAEALEIIDFANKRIAALVKTEGEAKDRKVKVRALVETSVDGVKFEKDQEGNITAKQYAAVAWAFTKLSAIVLLATLALLMGGQAMAQQYTTNTLFSAASLNTNAFGTVATGAYTNHPTAITLTKYGDVTIAVGFAPTNNITAGDGLTLKIWRSLGGTATEETINGGSCLFAAATAAGTANVGITNIPADWLGAAGYLYVGLVIPTNAPCTNVWVKYAVKPKRFGS